MVSARFDTLSSDAKACPGSAPVSERQRLAPTGFGRRSGEPPTTSEVYGFDILIQRADDNQKQ